VAGFKGAEKNSPMWVRRWSSQFEIACYFIQHSVNSDAGGCPEWRKFKQLCSKLGTTSYLPSPLPVPFPPLIKGDLGFSARPNSTVNQPKKSSGRDSAILISRLCRRNYRGSCFTPIPAFPHQGGRSRTRASS